MIQDIYPRQFHIEYMPKRPSEDSPVMFFNGGKVLIHTENDLITFPKYKDFNLNEICCVYLFCIDSIDFFLALTDDEIPVDGFDFQPISIFRQAKPQHLAFAGITANHVANWYKNNIYCGRCSARLSHSDNERALFCPCCDNIIYPKISPAVMVAVSDGDKLLLTKYSGREYKKFGLIAGFVEAGETIEETARREVMEEVGLKIKNIRYYKSQPWGLSESLLIGYFAELDGDSKITLDENELSEGVWIKKDEIIVSDDNVSLTTEMIRKFVNG